MKIIFFGTPDFAIPSLTLLNESNHEIVAVVTTPDKKSGRGLKIKNPPDSPKRRKLWVFLVKLTSKNQVKKNCSN